MKTLKFLLLILICFAGIASAQNPAPPAMPTPPAAPIPWGGPLFHLITGLVLLGYGIFRQKQRK